jgi:hypothetical protein
VVFVHMKEYSLPLYLVTVMKSTPVSKRLGACPKEPNWF